MGIYTAIAKHTIKPMVCHGSLSNNRKTNKPLVFHGYLRKISHGAICLGRVYERTSPLKRKHQIPEAKGSKEKQRGAKRSKWKQREAMGSKQPWEAKRRKWDQKPWEAIDTMFGVDAGIILGAEFCPQVAHALGRWGSGSFI